MGDIASWAADQEAEETERRYVKECNEIVSTLGAARIISAVTELARSIEDTPQTRRTYRLLDDLRKMLNVRA